MSTGSSITNTCTSSNTDEDTKKANGAIVKNHNQKKEKLKRLVIDVITKECNSIAIAAESTKSDKSKPKQQQQQHADILAISKGLKEDGKKLQLTILTGGLCNYSYKVHFEANEKENKNDVALFAKLTFREPVLFPGTQCSHGRTRCEYEAMELFGKVSPYFDSVATPYFCIDIVNESTAAASRRTSSTCTNDEMKKEGEEDDGDEEENNSNNDVDNNNNMKLLVTQFAPNGLEEQFANYFIDGGVIDTKFAVKLANSLSSLHNISSLDSQLGYNVDFNKEMKPFFKSLTNIIESIFNSFFEIETNIESETNDDEEKRKEGKTKGEVKQEVALDDSNSNRNRNSAVSKVGISIGKKQLDQVLIRYRESLNRTDCYIHGDCHLFNMLVEPAPTMESIIQSFRDDTDVEYNDNSGNNKNDTDGNIALIDWEMSTVGPIGKDIGSFYAFPLACVFAHAINGDYTGSGQSILKFLDILWKEYTTSILLPPGKKGVDSIDDIYHQLLGYCGVSTIAYSFLGFHLEYLPIDRNRTDNLRRIKESLGIIGLKFMNIGFAGSHDGISGRDGDSDGDGDANNASNSQQQQDQRRQNPTFLKREIIDYRDFIFALSVGLLIGSSIVLGFLLGILHVTAPYPIDGHGNLLGNISDSNNSNDDNNTLMNTNFPATPKGPEGQKTIKVINEAMKLLKQ
mmetsp:Transcript_46830/g.52194  ORF Transcript_46830/g.52194 Transcript_46830/m.52194 type:complete len:685 (+) Transcript_46830:164-2218(+)